MFSESPVLAPELKRLVVLPLAPGAGEADVEFGCDTLAPVACLELEKLHRFELVKVTPAQLRRWSGRAFWRGDERLPADFFERVREATGCDAVLFMELTVYRPYRPMVLGWRFRLMDCEEPRVLWSVDQIFDAAEGPVARAAKLFQRQQLSGESLPGDRESILLSPRRFARFTSGTLFATLPVR